MATLSSHYMPLEFASTYPANNDEYASFDSIPSDHYSYSADLFPAPHFHGRADLLQLQTGHQSPTFSSDNSIKSLDLSDSGCAWSSSASRAMLPDMNSQFANGHLNQDFASGWPDMNSDAIAPVSMAEANSYFWDPTVFTDIPFGFDLSQFHAGSAMAGFVDPSTIQPIQSPSSSGTPNQIHANSFAMPQPISPALSYRSTGQRSVHTHSHSGSPQTHSWPAHTSLAGSPRTSIISRHTQSVEAPTRRSSIEIDEDGRVKSRCPYPDCGKVFKDLKAHMLTHQDERPEKCPISSCEFHKRGFARKYDRNRHLVTTHYKSTVVCGFCPGSGSSTEKTFNRTDVFKRHLVAVHGVEQTPPNGRRKSPQGSSRQSPALMDGATGKCSTCSNLFSSAQELFEHLDDCVLRVVQQVDPAEATNEKLLLSVADDEDVKNTMERHNLTNAATDGVVNGDDEDDEFEGFDRQGKNSTKQIRGATTGVRDGRIGKSTGPKRTGAGITFSKGGVALTAGKTHRKRKVYPQSWGCATDKMKLKKRVLCVFDGQRRLWKDDMMLGSEHEVRMKLPDSESYVTDLDVETVKRAEGFHSATEEEKGPWVPTNVPDYLEQLMS